MLKTEVSRVYRRFLLLMLLVGCLGFLTVNRTAYACDVTLSCIAPLNHCREFTCDGQSGECEANCWAAYEACASHCVSEHDDSDPITP
jgi:hypothetical protein